MAWNEYEHRIIHTGLFTKKAELFFKCLWDSISENRVRYCREVGNSSIVRAADNEVLIDCKVSPSGYYKKSFWDKSAGNDRKAKEWIAIKLKEAVRRGHRYNEEFWSRDNFAKAIEHINTKTDERISFRVADAYFIYDTLLNRKGIDRKYGNALIEEMTGTRRDPLATELEIAKREKIKKLNEDYREAKDEIYRRCQRDIEEFRKNRYAQEEVENKALKDKLDADIRELENATSFLDNQSVEDNMLFMAS